MKLARILALALPLLGPLAAAQAQDAIRLDIPEAQKMAAILLNDGETRAARDVARTLLRRDPRDVAALLVLAQAELSLGRIGPAIAAGRRAYDAARTDAERFMAANVTAGAYNQSAAPTRAQLWLRRAAQAAPNQRLKQQAARDYRHVRAANPLSFQLSLAVAPSSNINNGSQHDREAFGGFSRDLAPSEKALSGTEYALGFDLRYRLNQSQTQHSWIAAGANARLYALSDDAKALAPDARADDYAYRAVNLGFGHSRINPAGTAETTLTFDLEQSWQGDITRVRTAEAAASRRININDHTQAQLRAAVERNWRLDQRRDDATVLSISGGLIHDLPDAGRFGVQLGFTRSDSISYRTAYDAVNLSLSYELAKPVLGAEVALFASIQQRNYDLPYIIFDPRKDTRVTLGTNLFFRDIDAFGFAPTMDIVYSKNRSNVGAYDGNSFTLGLGLKSTF